MDKKMKIFVGAVIIAIAGVLVWAFTSYEAPQVQTSQPTEQKSLSYAGNTIVEEKDGKKVWELTAATIEIEPNTNNTILKEIKGKFYQDNGNVVDLTAPDGIYDTKNQKVNFLHGIDAKATDGSSFKADLAQWDSAKKFFHAEGSVFVKKDDAELTGDKLDSDINLETIKVSGNAKIIKGGK